MKKDFVNIYEELSELNEDKLLDKIKSNMHRTHSKDFEALVVGRLLYEALKLKLDFETQYPVRLQDGKCYYVDLYFPQINLAVECDESHHLQQVAEDVARQAGITNKIAADFIRINAHDLGATLINETDQVILEMNQRKASYKGRPVDDYDYNSKIYSRGSKSSNKLDVLRAKKYLEDKNISKLFANQPIIIGQYTDALVLERNTQNIAEIALICYGTHLCIDLEYPAKFEQIVQSNIQEFKNIKNVSNVKTIRRPNILRFEINNTKFYNAFEENIDEAVEVALEIKNKYLDLIK